MVLMAAASDHRHRRAAKSSRQDTPVTPSPPAAKAPAEKAALHAGFSFCWGARRRLRCSKDGSPAYASASPLTSLPTQHPHTPSPDKEETPKPTPTPPAQGDGSSRPQRPRNLRPLRYAAAASSLRSDGALRSPYSSAAPPEPPRPGKRGFAVALSKEEIARDFAAIRCGHRTPRRGKNKRRKKDLQAKIDKLCPGWELANVDLDNYKIEER